MALTTYTYNVSDFPGGTFRYPSKLQQEISQSTILTALDHIDTAGAYVYIVFKAALSQDDQTTLNSVVANHVDEPVVAFNTTQLLDADGAVVNLPQTGGLGVLASKTAPRFTPDCFPPGYEEWITGALDNLDAGNAYANPVRGGGPVFQFEYSEPGDYQVVGQFFEHILMVGGGIGVVNGRVGDYVSFSCRAPASVPTANGGGTGNANKVQIAPGANIIVPAAGDGAWDVDGQTLLVGEINKDLVPVPNPTGAGFWDWSPDATPSLAPNYAQNGEYDLYDFAMTLGTQANKLPLIGSPATSFASPNVRSKPLLPHWEIVVDLHKASSNATTLTVGLYAICGRRVTRP